MGRSVRQIICGTTLSLRVSVRIDATMKCVRCNGETSRHAIGERQGMCFWYARFVSREVLMGGGVRLISCVLGSSMSTISCLLLRAVVSAAGDDKDSPTATQQHPPKAEVRPSEEMF